MDRRPHYSRKSDLFEKRGETKKAVTRHYLDLDFLKKKDKKKKITIRKKDEVRKLPIIKQDEVAKAINLMTPSKDEPEQLVIIKEGNKTLLQKSGQQNTISYEPKKNERHIYADSPRNSLYIIHSHPVWSTFSTEDVLADMLQYPSTKESYLITPKMHPHGGNIIYILRRRGLSRNQKTYDAFDPEFQKEFGKKWKTAMSAGEKHIRKNKEDKWFKDPTLREGSLGDKKIAGQLKGLEILGKEYGFAISAAVKSETLIASELQL